MLFYNPCLRHNINFVHTYLPAKDYELSRDRIELEDILGEGQFGDVHKGNYSELVSLKVTGLLIIGRYSLKVSL